MKISLVMTTYNGSKYIKNQLNSILEQTLKPDEVIICDDCSTDDTYDIIKNFISENRLNNWKLIKNSKNLGWRKNFFQVINKATGDIIFLSDQDDRWKSHKIKTIVDAFEKNRGAELFASNYDTEYIGNNNITIKDSKKIIGKSYISQVSLCDAKFEVIRPGCTMAFTKELVKYFNTIWEPIFSHDGVLWMISLLRNTAFIINDVLITQIRHEGTNTPSNERTKIRRIEILKTRKRLIEKILINKEQLEIKDIEQIEKYIFFINKRIEMLEKESILKWLYLLGYIKCYPKFKSWLGDFVCMHR